MASPRDRGVRHWSRGAVRNCASTTCVCDEQSRGDARLEGSSQIGLLPHWYSCPHHLTMPGCLGSKVRDTRSHRKKRGVVCSRSWIFDSEADRSWFLRVVCLKRPYALHVPAVHDSYIPAHCACTGESGPGHWRGLGLLRIGYRADDATRVCEARSAYLAGLQGTTARATGLHLDLGPRPRASRGTRGKPAALRSEWKSMT
jgi:hypothetical protein